MNRSLQDGLVIDNTVFIIDEKKAGYPISARIFQFLAIIIGSWSMVSVFLESISIPVNVIHINMTILITTGIMFALCLIPGYDVVKQFFGALFYILFAYSRFSRLQNGFYIVENLVLDKTSSYYGYQILQYKADYSVALEDATLLMIMILIPIVSLLTVAIVRNRYVSLSSLILFFPVSTSFLIGVIPSERYFIAYVISVLYLSRSGFSTRHLTNKDQKKLLHRIHSRAAVWLSLMGILLFFLVKFFVSPVQYEGVTEIKEIKTKLQTSLFNFNLEEFAKKFTDFRLPSINKASGGLNGGDLGKTGEVKYTNSEQLLLTAPITSIMNGIYLKGYVGSIYTGDKWEGHSKEDKKKYQELLLKIPIAEFPPVNQVSLLLNNILGKDGVGGVFAENLYGNYALANDNFKQGKMEIIYQSANQKYLYAPYFTDYELLDKIEYQQDLYSAPKVRNDRYKLDYFYNISLDSNFPFYKDLIAKQDGYSEYEKLYRKYVYQVYTKLPEENMERIKQDFSANKVQTTNNTTPERIEYVMNYLRQNTEYSLSPGKLPKGKDFVEYFLYENKVGYCSHYASAATLMLRSMGIPARYVEGYAVSISDVIKEKINVTDEPNIFSDNTAVVTDTNIVEIAVKDYNAHAWVEVYFDSCGWIPLEFTPGSAVDYNGSMVDEMALIGDILKEEDEEVIPTEVPTEPTPIEEEQEDKQPADDSEKDATTANKENEKQAIQIDALFFVFLVLIIAGIGITILIMKIRHRRRVRFTRNHNKKALFLFLEIEKILSSCKGLPKKGVSLEDGEAYVKEHCSYIEPKAFARCMETVRKARFGRGSITSHELEEVELFHQNLYDEVCKELSPGKKAYLKFILSV